MLPHACLEEARWGWRTPQGCCTVWWPSSPIFACGSYYGHPEKGRCQRQECSRFAKQIFVSVGGKEQNPLSSLATGFWCSPAHTTVGFRIPHELLPEGCCLTCGCRRGWDTLLSLLSFCSCNNPNYKTSAQMHLVIHTLFFPLFFWSMPGAVPSATAPGSPRVKSSHVKLLFDDVAAVEQQ